MTITEMHQKDKGSQEDEKTVHLPVATWEQV
jgi:hypothetical protein